MRATVVTSLLFACLCSTSGCSTSQWAWNRSTKPLPDALAKTEAAESKPAAPASEKPAEQPESTPKPVESRALVAESPFKSARAETAGAAPSATMPPKPTATTPTLPSLESVASAAPPNTPKTLADLNKDTLLLINRELQDATPEERAEWFEQLKHVDPALVPEILRARRMSLQLAQPAATPPQAEVLLAAGIVPPATVNDPMRSPPAAMPPRSSINWGGATANPTPADPFGVVPASHASMSPERSVAHAAYTEPAGARMPIEHAVHRMPVGESTPPIVLQNYETQPESNAASTATGVPPWTPPQTDPRVLPTTMAQPAGIAWPQRPAATPSPSGLGGVMPFGSNLVQNVAALVPGRGSQSANMPAGGLALAVVNNTSGSPFQAQLEQTTAYLEQEIAGLTPGTTPATQAEYVRKHVALRLLYLMGNHQERALTAIPGVAPAEQEFWQQLLWGMVNSLDVEHMPQAKDRATQTITQLNSAVRRLQEQADLQVRNVAFCRQILYFGNYEKLPRNEFSPGQEALLYAEIDNFKSEPTAAGQYRTLLRSTVEILSPSGELRKQIEFPATEDLCSTYRRDYFHNYQFRIPERMPLGPHILKLTVFDELSGKLTSYSVNFLVN